MIFLFFLSLYLSNLWTRFEDVDNLTAFWFCHVKVLLLLLWYYYYFYFSSRRSLLESELLFKRKKITKQKWKKKKNVWYSKDFYLCFLLLDTFPVVLAITSPSMIILFGFFLSEPSHLVFVFVCLFVF